MELRIPFHQNQLCIGKVGLEVWRAMRDTNVNDGLHLRQVFESSQGRDFSPDGETEHGK
jgi:hypothetical protein